MHHNSFHKLAAKFHPEASSFTIQVSLSPRNIYHSSSSSLPLCIALCLCLKASASPPASPELGVLRPLSDEFEFTLMPESRGAGGASACLRPLAAGRFAGGAGGVGLARTTGPCPFVFAAAGGGGGGIGRRAGAGGGGGASSFK